MQMSSSSSSELDSSFFFSTRATSAPAPSCRLLRALHFWAKMKTGFKSMPRFLHKANTDFLQIMQKVQCPEVIKSFPCWTVHLHLQQAFFFMGWAVRMMVLSLTLSSCSINTLSEDTGRQEERTLSEPTALPPQSNFLVSTNDHLSLSIFLSCMCVCMLFLSCIMLWLCDLTWPGASGTPSHSFLCRHWPRRTSPCFPAHDK